MSDAPRALLSFSRSPAWLRSVAVGSSGSGCVAGFAIDRFRARKVMLTVSLMQAAVVAALALLTASGRLTTPHLYLYAAAFGVLLAFLRPAELSVVPEVIPPEHVRQANAFSQTTAALLSISAAPVAGAAVAIMGSAPAFALNAASFLAAALCLWSIQSPSRRARAEPAPSSVSPTSRIAHLAEGFAAVRRDPLIATTLVVSVAASVGEGAAFVVGLPPLATLAFGAGSEGVGFLYGASAAGALGGALLIGSLGSVRRQGLLGGATMLGFGLFMSAAALAPHIWVAAPLIALGGACGMATGLVFFSLLQTRILEAARGRVMSLVSFSIYGVTPLTFWLAGLIGDALGPRAIVVFGGSAAALGGLLALAHRAVRNAESIPAPEPLSQLATA